MGILQKIAKSKTGQAVSAVVIIAAVVFAGFQLHSLFGISSAAAISNDRIFICSETNKSYHVNLQDLVGKTFPVYSPFSGKNTGYPAELCYWTADGKAKTEPTAVLLNSYINKTGPTFCPDCGRLVVGHNPPPQAGGKPPPTQAEYNARHAP